MSIKKPYPRFYRRFVYHVYRYVTSTVNAPEKIDSFPGRLSFFATFLLFFVRFVWCY